MPSVVPEIPPYERIPATEEDLDYVDLHVLDLAKLSKPGGQQELVEDLRKAIETVGFFLVKNSGIRDEDVLRQLSIGNAFFQRPLEEKLQHPCDFDNGKYWGYRYPKETYDDTGVRNPVEMLNSPKDTPVLEDEQLKIDFIKPFRAEIGEFSKQVHSRVLDPLLRLFSLLLELPEDYLAAPHAYDKASDDHLRYMIYRAKSAEESAVIGNQYVKGHTDFGVLTILFPQITSALQVQVAEGEYKYVPYIPDHIVVNTAEVLTFITGGHIKSTVHRVIRPPEDQAIYDRLGLLYFSRPADDFDIKIVPSPLLQRLGIYDPAKEPVDPPKGRDWGRARVKHTHTRTTIEHTTTVTPFTYRGHKIDLEYKSPAVAVTGSRFASRESTPAIKASA
ncbi:hypothetical protein JCM8097_005030 [Rhodosporidiobolus ruineniae]